MFLLNLLLLLLLFSFSLSTLFICTYRHGVPAHAYTMPIRPCLYAYTCPLSDTHTHTSHFLLWFFFLGATLASLVGFFLLSMVACRWRFMQPYYLTSVPPLSAHIGAKHERTPSVIRSLRLSRRFV